MNTPGYLSTTGKHDLWSKSLWEGYLAIASVGVLTGIAVAFARSPLHLPGHKAILWMTMIVAGRLATRARWGASAGTFVAAMTAILLGGRVAGGIAMLPLVTFAGVILDRGVQLTERHKLAGWQSLLIIAAAGVAGNLICFVDRLFDPTSGFFSRKNLDDLVFAGGSHAIFGALAGAIGAAVGLAALRFRQASVE